MSLGSNLINFGIAVYITLGEGEMTVSLFLKKMLVGVLHSKCNFFLVKLCSVILQILTKQWNIKFPQQSG